MLVNCKLHIPTSGMNNIETYLIQKSLICVPMRLQNHITYYYKLGKVDANGDKACPEEELEDGEEVERQAIRRGWRPVVIPESFAPVFSNYLLVKKILNNFKFWQELKMLCDVSTLFRDAIKFRIGNDSYPRCFFQQLRSKVHIKYNRHFCVEPEFVMAFTTKSGMRAKTKCSNYPLRTCSTSCKNKHRLVDYMNKTLCKPKHNAVVHECIKIIFFPPLDPPRSEITIDDFRFDGEADPCLSGLYIPKVNGLEVKIIKVSPRDKSSDATVAFQTKICEIANTKHVKCVLMFSNNADSMPKLEFMMAALAAVEDYPTAFGGCSIERTSTDQFHIMHSHRYVDTTFVLFLVDKENVTLDFRAYSKVVNRDDAMPRNIQRTIGEMSTAIQLNKNSIAMKLSCIGRDLESDELENKVFREHFPSMALVGCYGQGEWGMDYLPSTPKRKYTGGEIFSHAYTTVFILFTWGDFA